MKKLALLLAVGIVIFMAAPLFGFAAEAVGPEEALEKPEGSLEENIEGAKTEEPGGLSVFPEEPKEEGENLEAVSEKIEEAQRNIDEVLKKIEGAQQSLNEIKKAKESADEKKDQDIMNKRIGEGS